MRFARLGVAALTLAAAPCADARQANKLPLFAAQRLYNAGGPAMIGGGGRLVGPGKTYIQPALLNNYAVAFGDSRTANSTIFPPWSGASFTVSTDYSNGYAGWLFPLSGNRYLAEIGWNYGVGAQTTAGIAGRLFSTTQYCSDASTIGYACFNGASATLSAAISANPSSPLTIALSGVTGAPAAGDYITIANATNHGCQITAYNSATPSVTVPANCITATGAAGAAVALARPSAVSAFTTYAPFGATGSAGASITDLDTNKANGGAYFGGAYSIVTDPAQTVFVLAGTNDGARGAAGAISDLQAIFNAFGPTAANKIVIVGDELPRGLAEGFSRANANPLGAPEVWTVPTTSPYTVTAVNAANYWDTQQVFFAPCGATSSGTPANSYSCGTAASGVTFSAGASDGVALTPVASAPAQGQYAVNNGVYTFNSADAGKKIAIYYRWKAGANSPGSSYLTTIHNWLNATSCGSWTDPVSGTSYPGVSGAQCPGLYPWVHVAPTWSATLDAAAAASGNYLNLPYTSVDGLHPSPYGGAIVANAMLQAAGQTSAIPTTQPFSPATEQNYFFYGTSTTSTAAQTSTCGGTARRDYLSSVYVGGTALTAIPQAMAQSIFKTGSRLYFNNATQSALNGVTVTCVDAANGLVQLSSPSTVIMTGSTYNWAFVQNDSASPASFIGDSISGGDIYALQTNTSSPLANTGTPSGAGIGATVVKGVPYGWTLTTDSGTTTALSQGIMGLSYGVEQNPFGDGEDDFVLQLQGYAGTGTQITLSQLVQGPIAATFSAGQFHRAICRVKLSAGPNGHLYGVEGVAVKYYDQTTSGNFVPPGLASGSATLWAARQGGGAVEFNDANIASGAPGVTGTSLGNVLTLDELTPPAAVQGPGPFSAQLSFNVTYAAGDPVSATIRLQSCRAMQVSQ
jgi:hypothetical protein